MDTFGWCFRSCEVSWFEWWSLLTFAGSTLAMYIVQEMFGLRWTALWSKGIQQSGAKHWAIGHCGIKNVPLFSGPSITSPCADWFSKHFRLKFACKFITELWVKISWGLRTWYCTTLWNIWQHFWITVVKGLVFLCNPVQSYAYQHHCAVITVKVNTVVSIMSFQSHHTSAVDYLDSSIILLCQSFSCCLCFWFFL